ncbi:MAG TPA: hypothetical protein VFV13_07120 [Acidimicrobiia bacterium]|nr:hypothetical protein [Acidimicrobiia bacterium]
MRAVRLTAATGVDGVAVDEVPTPLPGEAEVLVEVHAGGSGQRLRPDAR